MDTDEPMTRRAQVRRLRTLLEQAKRIVSAYLPAIKSANEIVREYQNVIERLVADAANGNITTRAFNGELGKAVARFALEVYSEGMREGGIKDPESVFDAEDSKAVSDWIESQATAIPGFGSEAVAVSKLKGDERTAARDQMLARAALWVQSLESLGRTGYASAKSNQAGTWRLGKTEQHCSTCAKLHGQRHRLKWFVREGFIPRQPGNARLQCGGWNCDCEIVDDDGNRLM